MEKTRKLLMEDYTKTNDILSVIDVDSPQREGLQRERDNIRNELIKLDSIEIEAKNKKAEIEAENKREKIRNIITVGTFSITTFVSIWAVLKTFKFDQEGTVTSTLGRGILNNIIPKFKK